MKNKRILALLLCFTLVFSLSSCVDKPKNNEDEIKNQDEVPKYDDNKIIAIDNFPNPDKVLQKDILGDVRMYFSAQNEYFYKKSRENFELFYIKAINMGLTEPTTDLENPNVSYETYYDWFGKISQMNLNTVKIYSIMNENFYNALYDFNIENQKKPIYLIQGIWFNENFMYDIGNAFDKDEKIRKAFKKAIYETVDLVHGNNDYTNYGEFSPAIYDKDISKYVVGYVLGLEWLPKFVIETNEKNLDKKSFQGEYLKTTEKATPFEVFLCEMGDYLISHEYTNYKQQTPIAFLNWSATDVLTHTNEPFLEEDEVSVNTENIFSTEKYQAGLFAAVDVYPYYPEFINYQEEYLNYCDLDGKSNPYRGYLNALKSTYSVPVLLAEFGLPTSRGVSHLSVMGYNQGGLTEEQQGEYVSKMQKDIALEGYCGSAIFSWQDEWFKRTWNTNFYSPKNANLRTQNMSSAEQSYGILAFDAASVYSDGAIDDWENAKSVVKNENAEILTKYDPNFLNILIKTKGNFDKETLYIPISTTGTGSAKANDFDLKFSENCDFLLVVNGKENTKILTSAYNDVFHFNYAIKKDIIKENRDYRKKQSGIFNPIYTFVSNEMYLPDDDLTLQPVFYESGILKYGNNNPNSQDFNSLADFFEKDGNIEIRIPWYLISIVNSAEKLSIGDFYNTGKIDFVEIDDIKIGIAYKNQKCDLQSIEYSGLTEIKYQPRLKKSYEILKDSLKGLME